MGGVVRVVRVVREIHCPKVSATPEKQTRRRREDAIALPRRPSYRHPTSICDDANRLPFALARHSARARLIHAPKMPAILA